MSNMAGKAARVAVERSGKLPRYNADQLLALNNRLSAITFLFPQSINSQQFTLFFSVSPIAESLLISALLIGEISAKISRVSTVQEISQAIEHLNVRDQMRLLHDLPAHLKIQPDDVAWLKAAEPAFEFWNNPEDAIYDEL
jgi:hypothetical protein